MLNHLPLDLLFQITSHLDPPEVLAVASSCRDINFVLKKTLATLHLLHAHRIPEYRSAIEQCLSNGAAINFVDPGYPSSVPRRLEDHYPDGSTPFAGYTALHWACWMGLQDVVLRLLNEGAHPNALANNGETPLSVAASQGSLRICFNLLEAGASPNLDFDPKKRVQLQRNGWSGQRLSPLNYAVMNRNRKLIQLLIWRGAELNPKNCKNGMTPLYFVKDLQTARTLVCAGASRDWVDERGMDPAESVLICGLGVKRGVVEFIRNGGRR